ncbi:DUF1015 family protein [bacterium]|nr:DUF1015 family protein [bacterium]
MVDVSPFRGWRYDLSQVGDLSDVLCPPYDVIDPNFQTELYKRHPCNVIRLELNRAEPGDADSNDRYRRAASFWKHWRIDGVLRQDPDDLLYVYSQTFTWEGQEFTRQGFLGRVRLEEFGAGSIFPHEQTLSGPKADRLALFQACKANLSPIFGLYPDSQQEVQQRLSDACITLTPLQATDHLGVIHRLWPVSDSAVINSVRAAMRERSVFIADGHHRYETGLNYRRELQQQGRLNGEYDPANFVMMHLVGMQDPGLQVLPTHRLVSGLPTITTQELKHALDEYFELEFMGVGESAARDTWDMVTADGSQSAFGFGSAADGGWLFARLVDPRRMPELAPDKSEAWRSLGVSQLHKLVLEDLLPRRFPQAQPQCRYVHQWEEVSAALQANEAQLGCLVQPASIDDVEMIAGGHETMPPKSTYFYPKLLTGLVFYSLEDRAG